MKESTLLKFSIVFAVIGMISMLYLSEKIQLKVTDIASISQDMLDKNIKIKGSLISINTMKTLQVIKIQDKTGSMEAVLFNSNQKMKKGSYIEVEGKVSKYKNNLQINADLVKVLE